MKGIILAGGKGTRLFPLTKVTNKHLLPVGTEPMILHPIKQLISAGIREILIVTSKEHMGDVVNLLGSGKEYDCDFTFKVQEEAKGIAHALLLGENFANGEPVIVMLGDNIATKSIKGFVARFLNQPKGARVLIKKVEDPERYGVAAIDEKKIIQIEEKPHQPKSDFAVIGIYAYDSDVFKIIKNIKPSERGEYEITSVNNFYIRRNELFYDIIDGKWTDAGTFESLLYANQILLEIRNNIEE